MAEPLTGTLVFDADCGFCTKCADWARTRLRDGRVAPSHTIDAATYGLTRDDLDAAAWWLPAGGAPVRGHEAVAAALRQCRGAWPLLGRVVGSRALRPVAARVYDLVAVNRYRLPGSDGTCATPE